MLSVNGLKFPDGLCLNKPCHILKKSWDFIQTMHWLFDTGQTELIDIK